MNDLYGLLSLMLASFPLLTSADVDCGDKPFHCINSTHFNVCVDLGTGTLRTIDSVTIQCPDGTVCLETNFYECEFPVTSTPVLKTSEVTKVIDMFGAISTDKINISSSKHENSDSTYNTVATTTLSEVERIKDGRAASEITPQGDYTTTPYLIANKSLPVSNEANLKPFVNKAKQNITEGNIPKLPSDDIYSTTIVSNMLSEEFSTKYNQNITPLEENIIDDTINENSNDNVLTGIDTTVTYMPKVQNNNYLTDNYLNLFKNEFTVFNNSILSNAPPTEYLISNNTFNIDELHDKLISSFEIESTDISPDMITDFIDDGILKSTGFSRDVKGDNDILISTANKVIVEIESLNTQPVQISSTYLSSTADYITENIPEIKQSLTGFSSETFTSSIISHDITTESVDDIILTSTIDKIDSLTTKSSAQTLTTYLPSTADFTTESIPEIKQSSTGFSSETLTSSITSHDVTTESIDDIILTSTIDKIDSSTTKPSAQTLTTYLPSTVDFTTESILENKQRLTDFSSETLTSSIISRDITTESIDDIILTSINDKIDSSTTKPSAQTLTTYIPSTVDFTTERIPEIIQSSTGISSETLTSSIISHDITTESIDDIILTSTIDKIDSSTTKSSAQTLTTYLPSTVNFTTESIPEIKQISTILSSETLTTSINSHGITAESMDDIILTSTIDKIDSSNTKPSAPTLTTYKPSTADFTTERIPEIKQSSTGFSSETLISLILSHDITTESIDDIILTSTIDKIDSSTTKPSAQTITTDFAFLVDYDTSAIIREITTGSINDNILTSNIDELDPLITEPFAQTPPTHLTSRKDIITESISEISESLMSPAFETRDISKFSRYTTAEFIEDITLTPTIDKVVGEIDSSTTESTAQILITDLSSTADFISESIAEVTQSLSLSTLKSNISNNIDSSSEILNTIKNKSKSPFVEFEEPSSTGNIGTFDITYNNSESMLKTEGKTKSLPDILTDITRNSSTTSTSHSNESSVLKNNLKQGGIISLKTYSTENSRENTLDINNKQNTTTSYILKKDKSVHERLQFTSPLPHIETTTLDIPILTTNIGYPTTSLNNLLQQNINATQYNIQQSNISTFIADPNESRFFNSSEIDFKNEIKLENFTENLQITTENRLQVITNKSNITNNKETNILSQPLITIDNRKSQHNSQYDGLSNLNQHNFTQLVKPNMTEKPITSVYSVLKSNFSCRNRKNGKYGDNNDCSTFYICIGRQNPIKRKCPVNTVFSEIRKQCTNNLSHCIRNNTFRCLSEGRFSDIFKDKFYYICIKNNSSFIRYKFQCADGFHLNKTSVKCIKDIEISQSEDSLSKNSSEKNIFEGNSSEKSDNYHSNKFECKEAGKFADPTNCRKYYECIKKKSRFRRKSKKCKKNKVFDRDKKTCVDNESYEC